MIDYLVSLPGYFYTSLGIMASIAILLAFVGIKVSKLDPGSTPNRFLTFFIAFVKMFNDMIKGYVGKNWRVLSPLVLSLAIYVFVSNVSGMFALDAPTKYTAITFSLSIFAFLIIQITGIISSRWGHLLGLLKPFAPMLPLNLIGEVTP